MKSARQASKQVLGRRTYASGKDIKHGIEARRAMLDGVEKLTKAVVVTLGPKGRNVIIQQPYGSPKITKMESPSPRPSNSRTLSRTWELSWLDRLLTPPMTSLEMVTTTSTLLSCAVFKEGYKAVATGSNPMDLKRGMDLAVKKSWPPSQSSQSTSLPRKRSHRLPPSPQTEMRKLVSSSATPWRRLVRKELLP